MAGNGDQTREWERNLANICIASGLTVLLHVPKIRANLSMFHLCAMVSMVQYVVYVENYIGILNANLAN